MRRHTRWLCALAVLGGCATTGERRADDLKVTRAVLYQNGIGYFERQGTVEGQEIRLRILPAQIADVLKSLTVVDLGTGRAVNIALPVEKTRARLLAALPEQVRESGGLVGIARAFRGARATVRGKEGKATGRLVGVEQLGDEEHATWRLTVLTDDGTLHSFDATGVTELQVQDRTLEVGPRKALDVSLDEGSWKPVELVVHLTGPTPHQLLVSYVVEMPTWKPAYRVVLSKGQANGLLQGWAVVDNVSGEDWNRVWLSLTAGTPLTFAYDLYTPRFVRRSDLSPQQEAVAEAPPPATGSAGPADQPAAEPEAESKVAEADEDRKEEGDYRRYKKKAKGAMRSPARPRGAGSGAGMRGDMMARAEAQEKPAAPPPPRMSSELLEKSFSALVAGAQVGSLFRYDIEAPVTIKDRQSALVSILNTRVPAEDVLLFRVDSSANTPYRAVRLTNTTGYVLEKGPVAIYRDGSFVGEAVGGQVEASSSTFIPYSVDGRVLVTLDDQVRDESARLVRIVNGQLTVEAKQVAVHKYTVHNRTGEAATLFVQRQHRVGWKLTQPDKGVLIEKDYYFAPVRLAEKGKTTFEVREETPVRRWAEIFSHEGQQAIRLYLKDPSADPKLTEQLKQALKLQEELSKLEDELERLRREKNAFSERQTQVRENLKLLGKALRNQDLAKKLTATLLELEGKLNDVTRKLVAKDMQRATLRDRVTVILKSVTLETK